jgi:hypothetical protein
MLAASAAALRRRLANARSHKALYFQAVERDVHSADRQIPSGSRFNFAPDRRAVRVRTQPDQRQQHELFELAKEGFGSRYLLHNVNYMTACPRFGWRRRDQPPWLTSDARVGTLFIGERLAVGLLPPGGCHAEIR